ncbi:MAG: hypothetical protein HY829_10640 [Actinobacteria bacterium]|nr:hypothetical protein [Actinomycetota bacterium]
MHDFPITPGQAIAIAAILDASKPHLPHWTGWAERLRRWGEANLASDIGPNDIHADVTPAGGGGSPIVVNIAPAAPQVIIVRRPRIDGYR